MTSKINFLVVSVFLSHGLLVRADEKTPKDSAQEKQPVVKATTPELKNAKWWMTRHEKKLADLKKAGDVDLLMIGDSITHGWEGKGRDTWAKFYENRKAFNIGFSGDRTENVLWRLQHGAMKGISPKLAVIMIGTNNTGHRQDDPKHTAKGIELIVDEVHKQSPKTKVLLLAIFPRGAKTQDKLRKINDATNQIISKLDDRDYVTYLDINSTFLDDQGNLPKSVMPDLLHPNKEGYVMWAKAMEPSIAKLMGE